MTALNKQALREAVQQCIAQEPLTLVVYHGKMCLRNGGGIVFSVLRDTCFPEYSAENENYARFAELLSPTTVLALLDELEAAEGRIAELEARTVQLPPTFWYEHDDLPRDIPVLSRRLVIKALREAGVKFAADIGVKGE